MPRGENVRLVITVQSEPVSGQVYAYGILAQGLKDVLGENPKPIVEVAAAPHPECSAELERQFVRALYGLLRPVHDYNTRKGEWKDQKSLQAYTFDTYERDRLTEVLLRRVDDPEVAEEALQVFFHFQRPELIQARNQPSDEVVFPVVVLVDVLRDRVALPLDIAYRFADAARLLMPSQFGFAYLENDYYSFPLSNQMRSDAIFAVWHQGKEEYVERIEREVRNRLMGTNSLINGIRERLGEAGRTLFAWPPKFRLPVGVRPPPSRALAAGVRGPARVDPSPTWASASGGWRRWPSGCATARPCASPTWATTASAWTPRSGTPSPTPDTFPNWILTEESEDGAIARLSFDDYAWKDRMYAPAQPAAGAGRGRPGSMSPTRPPAPCSGWS